MVEKNLTISSLFQEEPEQWGMRGDPFLWKDMQEHFQNTRLPDKVSGISLLVKDAFEILTEHPITTDKEFLVIEKYSHGGMSSGGIVPKFWLDTAIPLLRARYKKTQL